MYPEVKTILFRPIVPMLCCLVLIVLIFWKVTTAIVFFWSSDKSVDTVTTMIEVNEPTVNSINIVNTSFFGEYVPVDIHHSDIKQSMLDLKVVGIIFSENEDNSHVIIKTAGDQEQIFHIGDSLPGGVVIKRITSQGVLVGRNGSLESLSLPKNELIFQAPATPLIEK